MHRQFDFMVQRRLAVGLSCLLVLGSLVTLGVRGLNFGLDFTGGTLVEVRFAAPVSADEVRHTLASGSFADAVVQSAGSEREVLIRVPAQADAAEQQVSNRLAATLGSHYPGMQMQRAEFVGPAVGEDLRESGGLAILAAFLGITVYVGWRFTGKFAAAAVIALIHDAIITTGAFALLQWPVDLSTVAALLTVIGYSLNDTIVICDRIRENLRKLRRRSTCDVINLSLNQTLERTLIMSGTTVVVLLAMLTNGGEMLRGFAFALTIGVVVGTWSSIYVAAAYLLFAGLQRQDLLLPEAENPAA